jgi:FKBP-type peptidyl-prolyl cis-trans isomerase 2
MADAKSGDIVRIHYTGKLDDGNVFDSSEGRDPLQFTIGENNIIPKLEAAIIGMAEGDKATVEIIAAEAYGPHQPEAVQIVERSVIPGDIPLEVGTQLQATGSGGQPLLFTVVEVTDENVTLDGNHPLAGQDLTFDVELVEIIIDS